MRTLQIKLLLLAGMLTAIVAISLHFAIKQSRTLQRDPNTLLNKYYILKSTHEATARQVLYILLKQNANDTQALKELTELLLNEKKYTQAYPLVKRLTHLLPDDAAYPLILSYLDKQKKEEERQSALATQTQKMRLFKQVALNSALIEPKKTVFDQISFSRPRFQRCNLAAEGSEASSNRDVRRTGRGRKSTLTQYYDLLQKNEEAAWRLIQKIIVDRPDDVQALKAGGYLAIKRKNTQKAIAYFERAEQITHEVHIQMQLAYLYAQLNQKMAWKQFQMIAKQDQGTYRLRANNALVNMAGSQTKALPPPYFWDVYFTPFTQSRFGLTVRPFITRAGIQSQVNAEFGFQSYLFVRQTDDNRSENLGELSQIYEDNVRIFGVGTQMFLRSFPHVSAYIEAGRAYDLIFQNRDRWRFDLRSSLTYYNEYGSNYCYVEHLKWPLTYYSTAYANATYFSRYHNNVIGTLMTQQGVRLLQFHNTVMNLYVMGRGLSDTNRDFFNNFIEGGPGIGIIPNNRFNLQLRFESLKGMYLPAGGKEKNPYGKYYDNRLVRLLFYVKI